MTWACAPPDAALPGYVCLIARRHVREPYELPEGERRQFWDDLDRVAKALASRLEPRPSKINYEIHGNTVPHLHAHLFPRTAGDRFEGLPIDGRLTEPRTTAELASIRTALASVFGDSEPSATAPEKP